MKTHRNTLLACALLAAISVPSFAHHSYAMFDGSTRHIAQGVVAKLEWQNPHAFLWVYVTRAGSAPQLLALESDSTNLLRGLGWHRDVLVPGQRLSIEYFALRDGRLGGHLIRVTREDGTTLSGAPGPVNAIELGSRLRERR